MNLKDLRLKKHLTQEELASKIGAQRSTITSIELGYTKPSIETAKKLGNFFNVKWTKFFE